MTNPNTGSQADTARTVHVDGVGYETVVDGLRRQTWQMVGGISILGDADPEFITVPADPFSNGMTPDIAARLGYGSGEVRD